MTAMSKRETEKPFTVTESCGKIAIIAKMLRIETCNQLWTAKVEWIELTIRKNQKLSYSVFICFKLEIFAAHTTVVVCKNANHGDAN
jgi:hypothetical protein